MCLNASAFSEIITVWKLFSMQTSRYKGTPREKKNKKNTVLPIFFQVNAELRVVAYEKTFLNSI